MVTEAVVAPGAAAEKPSVAVAAVVVVMVAATKVAVADVAATGTKAEAAIRVVVAEDPVVVVGPVVPSVVIEAIEATLLVVAATVPMFSHKLATRTDHRRSC